MYLMSYINNTPISPFYVMEILEEAQKIERKGKKIIHLEIGEPTEEVDSKILLSANKAISSKKYKYTNSLGILELRTRISKDYKKKFKINIDPDRILLTTGSSAAILLSILTATKKNDEIIIISPHYPCYPQILKILGRKIKIFNTYEKDNYQIDIDELKKSLTTKTKALIVNTPANPTGVSQSEEVLKKLCKLKIQIISDEIYQGLSIDYQVTSILKHNPNKPIVVNGFSKLYSMTGWRLGYVVLPVKMVRYAQKLQQNMFICAPTISQHAALSTFDISVNEKKKLINKYKKNRNFVLKKLKDIEIKFEYEPDSAFYIFCDMSKYTNNSLNLCKEILNKVGLALAPGIDFGKRYKKFVRISYASSYEEVKEGMNLLSKYLKKYNK